MASRRRTRKHDAWSTTLKSAELAWATPQVVAHRLGRMAASGPIPSARDSAEFTRMWSEKVTAFNDSWAAMALQGFAANQAMASSLLRGFWNPWRVPSSSKTMAQMNDATWGARGGVASGASRRGRECATVVGCAATVRAVVLLLLRGGGGKGNGFGEPGQRNPSPR